MKFEDAISGGQLLKARCSSSREIVDHDEELLVPLIDEPSIFRWTNFLTVGSLKKKTDYGF